MDRKNKIVLSSLAFAIPELIWSPVSTIFLNFFIYKYIFRDTSLLNSSKYIITLVVAIQCVGIVVFSILAFKESTKSSGVKKVGMLLLGILGIVLSIISLFVFLILTSLGNIGF